MTTFISITGILAVSNFCRLELHVAIKTDSVD